MSDGVKKVIIAITIIILVALFINSLTGSDGFFAKRREEKILVELAKVMSNMEENIASVKANNTGDVLSSGEMLQKLEGRGLLSLSNKGVMQGTIISGKISNMVVGYNGDVYLNNYKRGSLPLSSMVSEMQYQNPFNINQLQNLKVIDGEIVTDKYGNCWICSMIGRNDFACWINESGEMVSIEKNMPFSYEAQDTQYIAIYNNDLKTRFANKYVINTTSNAYIEEDKVLFNVMSYNYYQRATKPQYLYDAATYTYNDAYIGRTLINSFGVYVSDNPDTLHELKGENLASFNLSDLGEVEEKNYSNNLRLSVMNCQMNAEELKEKLESAWGKELKRVYYRAGVDANYYQREEDVDLTEEEKLSFCLEPAIKYFNFD
ncbi:MAG: hypothetical protein IJ867_01255 [Clostridia bacterium]|nr:hypothetical protein [Clostridia bacterium]